MSWVVCIPSHNRSKSINERTLKVLCECGIPADRIKVYVAPEEMAKYREAIAPSIAVCEGAKGCMANRQAILDDFPEGSHLIFMDDDIQDIVTTCDFTEDHSSCKKFLASNLRGPDYMKHRSIGASLGSFLDSAWSVLEKEGAYLGGVNMTNNGFFYKHAYRVGLNYICGAFYFERVRKDFKLTGYDQAEDFNRSCQYFKRDGKTVRFLFVGLKTQFYKGGGDKDAEKHGGLCDQRTFESERIAKTHCAETYSDIVDLVLPTPKLNHYDLKCKRFKGNVSKEWC